MDKEDYVKVHGSNMVILIIETIVFLQVVQMNLPFKGR